MTDPEIYVVGMLSVLLLGAYGLMRWNRHLIRSHRAPQSEDHRP